MNTITERREKLELMHNSRETINRTELKDLIFSIGSDIAGTTEINLYRQYSEEKLQLEYILHEMDNVNNNIEEYYRSYVLPNVIKLILKAQIKDPVANN